MGGIGNIATLYAIRDQSGKGRADLTGNSIVDARVSYDEIGDVVVSMTMDSDGAKTWRLVKWDTDVMPYPGEKDYSSIDEAYKKASWRKARQVRNALLAETDYLALSDSTLTAEMTTYRQNLRDLPATYPDINDIVWPTKP